MAIRITRVYTRTGDRGDTALVGGRRVPKDSARIEAYGTIDELNSIIGLARVFNAEQLERGPKHRWLDEALRKLQNELFDLGSELATPADAVYEGMFRMGEAQVAALERQIDECQKDLQPLKYVNRLGDLLFVLSRWVGKHLGETEYLWERGLEAHARKKR